MRAGSNWTGRAPRSLDQAFGPYETGPVIPMRTPPTRIERIADAMLAVVLGIIGAALLVHWICS